MYKQIIAYTIIYHVPKILSLLKDNYIDKNLLNIVILMTNLNKFNKIKS